jgi:hypothetical protein
MKKESRANSSKESYRLCKKECETKKEARAQQRAVEPLMNECMKKESIAVHFRVSLLSQNLHWGGT